MSAQEAGKWQEHGWAIHSSLVMYISKELGFWWNREEMAVQRGKRVGGEKTSNWGTAEETLLLGNNQASIRTGSWKKHIQGDRSWIPECIMKGLERNCKIKLWLKQAAGSLEKLLEEGGWSVQIILQNIYMKRYRDHLSTFTPAA